jgi:biopolymer transport protein ExbB/TolQ
MDQILEIVGVLTYAAMAAIALYGVYSVIMLSRRIKQKRFASQAQADQFLEEVGQELRQRNYDAVVQLCDSPPWWSKAVPQLVLLAMANLHRGPSKLKRLLAERFEADVLADLEYRTSWISTVVKSAPMLGLFGTVVGMIMAFGKIATAQSTGIKPEALASDISFALVTTALGLTIAIPLVLAGNMIHVRIGKLQDAVQQDLGRFFDALDESQADRTGATA